jgi:tyrosyl-tRNA synthetase
MKADMKSGVLHPRNVKVGLAKILVDRFHGAGAGQAAEDEFNRIFVNKGVPDDMPEVRFPVSKFSGEIDLGGFLKECNLVDTSSEARRLVQSNAVEIAGAKVSTLKAKFDFKAGDEIVLKVGKKKFAKLIVEQG